MKYRIAWLCFFIFVLLRALQARPELLDWKRLFEGSPFERRNPINRIHLATNRFPKRIRSIESKAKTSVAANGIIETDANSVYNFNPDRSLNWKFEPNGHSEASRMTAWTDQKMVFVGMKNGPLYALNKADGSVVWTVNAIMIQFNQLPIPLENSLIYVVDREHAPESFVIRIDKRTGEILWQSEFLKRHLISSPVLNETAQEIHLTLEDGAEICLSAKTGDLQKH